MPFDCRGKDTTIGTYLLWLRSRYGIGFQQSTRTASNGDMLYAYKVRHNSDEVVIVGEGQEETLSEFMVAHYDRVLGT
mgnify:CR=1